MGKDQVMFFDDEDDDMFKKCFFDPDGNPYKGDNVIEQWAKDNQSPKKLLSQTMLKNKFFVSTIWLGFDMGFGLLWHEPKIYETMVFDPRGEGVRQWRYSTKEEALGGHLLLCTEYENVVFIPCKDDSTSDPE